MKCYGCNKELDNSEKKFIIADMDYIVCERCRDEFIEMFIDTINQPNKGDKYYV